MSPKDESIDGEGARPRLLKNSIERVLAGFRVGDDGVSSRTSGYAEYLEYGTRPKRPSPYVKYDSIQYDSASALSEYDRVEVECGDPCGEDGCICLRRGFARAFDDRIKRE